MAYDHESIPKVCEIKLRAANKAFNFLFFWHSMEAGFFGLCSALSFSICVVITFVNQKLLDECSSNFEKIVDTNLHKNYSHFSNENVMLVKENARRWSFDHKFYGSKCQFTQYSQLAAGVGAFILCWFFVILRPRKFTFLQKCVGLYEFFDYSIGNDIYSCLLVAQIFSWLSIICWLINFITLLIRFYYHFDFPTYASLNKVPRRRKPANHNQQDHCANGPCNEESDKLSNKGSSFNFIKSDSVQM
uniref:Uncharacterized protein n=1 Tax=Romanomermis culicivorax TaxID=13658 RepID=A0A915KHV0_ROMCU